MPRNTPTGFICAFFATFMGFALIWHIWWLVARRRCRRLRDLRRVRLARRGRVRHSGRGGRAHRSRQPQRAPRGAQPARAAVMTACRRRCRPRRPAIARTAPARGGRGRWRPGAEAHHRRLRLLDLPAQRHRDVLRLLRGLRGAGRADGGRPERAGAVRPQQRRDRDRVPAAVELHLRPGQHRAPTAQPALVP